LVAIGFVSNFDKYLTMIKQVAPSIGIDDMAAYIPQTYLPIATLAEARGIAYAKLNKGLGLTAMAVPDAGEDAATMMANAVRDLLEKNNLSPAAVGRIYLGTESAIDGAKPTASYALQMLQAYFEPQYGPDCFLNCDVVDLTFACIGAVDALQNTLDWIRADHSRIGIVVASDNAKYELGSTGEYTQGAGAVAVLVKANPRILAIGTQWGIGTRAVYDFYKPLRKVKKGDLIAEVLKLADRNHVSLDQLVKQLESGIEVKGVLDSNEKELTFHKDTPVFDGPYSNDCYQARIKEALQNYKKQAGIAEEEAIACQWERLVFHLPYAYQARRMFGEIFWQELKANGQAATFTSQLGRNEPQRSEWESEAEYDQAKADFWRAITKTDKYQLFVQTKIEAGERASSLVGNMYAASIFLSLMSTLEVALTENSPAIGAQFGFFAYGSGSKSKVFVGQLQEGWRETVANFGLFEQLDNRKAINYATYEQLHRQALTTPTLPNKQRFYQQTIDEQGVRTYYIPTALVTTEAE
jgi:hydroxymethylglutaryl-CoA synthase